jgi:Terminase small subunit
MGKAITDEVSKLTAKQMYFVEAFLADPSSATAAAITAGYGQKSAHVSASRLIRLPNVLQALMQGVRGVLQRAAIKAAIKLEKLIDHRIGYVALEASKDALNRNGIGINDGGAGQRSGLTVNIVIPDPNGGHQGPMLDVTPGGQNRGSSPCPPPPHGKVPPKVFEP